MLASQSCMRQLWHQFSREWGLWKLRTAELVWRRSTGYWVCDGWLGLTTVPVRLIGDVLEPTPGSHQFKVSVSCEGSILFGFRAHPRRRFSNGRRNLQGLYEVFGMRKEAKQMDTLVYMRGFQAPKPNTPYNTLLYCHCVLCLESHTNYLYCTVLSISNKHWYPSNF